jgi:diguanylate cyclase (GGDEF)-like protein
MKDASSLRNRALRLLLFSLTCCHVYAQQYAFQYFGVEQGLTNLAIKTLFQDRSGFIWVVTEHGVLRYEGVRFREFTPEQGLPPSVTASIGEAPDGSVLVGNQSGLFRLRGERFEKVLLPFSGGASSGDTKINGYNSIFLDGNRTWIGTEKGLLFATTSTGSITLHPGPVPPETVRNNVQSLYVEGRKLWWGCDNALCSAESVNEGSPEVSEVRVLDGSAGLKPFHIGAILCDHDGNVWLTQNRRLMVRKAGAVRFEDADPNLPPTGPGSSPHIDSDGRLLVPTTAGLAIREGSRFHVAGRSTGMLPPVYSVLQDREGSMWIGLAGRGLAKWLGYNEWESFSAQSGLTSETVYEILPQKNGDVWAGTEAGFFHGHRGQFEWAWQALPAVGQTPVHAVQQAADGRIWLGTDGRGVARFDPKTSEIRWFGRSAGLDANSPNTILIDHEQNVWAGTENGVFIAEHGTGRFQRVNGIPPERCSALIQTAGGDIWAGTKSGVWQRSGNTWRRFGKDEGMGNDAVLSLAFDPAGSGSGSYGTIWVGYRLTGAITRLRFENGANGTGKPTVTQFPAPGGPAVNITYFLGFDSKNHLWAGTNLGVQVLDQTTNRWDKYDHRDGLIWDDCDLHAFAAEPDGHVWIGTSGGLSRFLPHANPVQPGPPRTVFTGVYDGKTQLDPASDPTLAYTSDPLVARFTALRFGRDRDLVFRYRLTPLVSAWKETPDRELQFPALPPGSYRLEVQARDSKSGWSEIPATFDFRVLAPWWRTWWFLGGCLLAGFLAAGVVFRRRTSREVAVRHALENAVAERTRELSHQYRHDVLTGLPNRLLFGERLSRELLTAERRDTRVAVLFIDLDRFKRINDTWGHQTGDLFLKQIAERLRTGLLESETIARIGGDEFIVLIPALSDKNDAHRRGWDLLRCLEAPFHIEGKNVFATMSVGIAVFPDDSRDPGALMAAADAAMYRAKDSGKNQVRLFEAGMTEAASRPQNIEDRLREALNTGGFRLRYQPQYRLDGKLEGFEALLRLQGYESEVPPGEFIPIAEESGLIIEMGAWVLEESCRQMKEWHDAGFPDARISVNVSVMQLAYPGFEEQVLDIIRRTGIDPTRLELELTETALVKDTGDSAGLLNRIRSFGIQVALDDFGTGYSPMQYLHQLPVDVVKIDQVFVRDLDATPSSIPLVEGMVKLAKTLSLRVVAEGVETWSQFSIVRRIGFDIAQGNLLSLPVTPAQAEALLRRGSVALV